MTLAPQTAAHLPTVVYIPAQQHTDFRSEYFGEWVDFIDRTEKTVQTYTRAIRRFAEWLSDRKITCPQRSDVIAYKKELEANGKSPATVTLYLVAVRRFFTWTEIEGLYPNIAREVRGEKIDREHKRDYLTQGQCREVLAKIDTEDLKGKRDFAIISLLMTCGLRTVEVVRANIEDLRTAGNNVVLYVQGKGRDERTEYVKVPAQTERAIRAYLRERGSVKDRDPLFASVSNHNDGERMTTRSVSRIAKGTMQEVGLNDRRHTAHSFRHTAVTLALIGNDGDLQEAAQFARHADISTTTIYAHNIEREKNKCSELVARMIFDE